MNTVIIGANRGIGLELVKQYLLLGHTVFAVCRTAGAELDTLGCHIIQGVDVCDEHSVASLNTQLPIAQIDILIHNSGILISDSFPNISTQNIERHIQVNTLGPLNTILALQNKLSKGSKVGIVSSRVGSITDNSSSNNYAYRISKTAVNMLGKCLSIDLAPKGVALALLHPGYVRTEMTGGRGLIEPTEAASGLIDRMNALTLSTTGQFVHASGEALPW